MATAAFERFTSGRRTADSIGDRVAHVTQRIRREPFKFVGLAFAIAVPIGVVLGLFAARPRRLAAIRREWERGEQG